MEKSQAARDVVIMDHRQVIHLESVEKSHILVQQPRFDLVVCDHILPGDFTDIESHLLKRAIEGGAVRLVPLAYPQALQAVRHLRPFLSEREQVMIATAVHHRWLLSNDDIAFRKAAQNVLGIPPLRLINILTNNSRPVLPKPLN